MLNTSCAIENLESNFDFRKRKWELFYELWKITQQHMIPVRTISRILFEWICEKKNILNPEQVLLNPLMDATTKNEAN